MLPRHYASEGSLAKLKSPKKTNANHVDHPSLFDWAESLAARMGRTLNEITAVATAGTPVVWGILLSCWLSAAEDSPRRNILAIATLLATLLLLVTWGTAACQSGFSRKGIAIFLQASALCGLAVVVFGTIGTIWWADARRDLARSEAAQKAEQVARSQQEQAEAERKKKEREAAANKVAESERLAKLEADQQVEKACLDARLSEVERAAKAERSARKAVETCKSRYANEVFPLKTVDEACSHQLLELRKQDKWLSSAASKTCATGSLPSVKSR